jgi:hypothetical protein
MCEDRANDCTSEEHEGANHENGDPGFKNMVYLYVAAGCHYRGRVGPIYRGGSRICGCGKDLAELEVCI